jgi:hypothetical protein
LERLRRFTAAAYSGSEMLVVGWLKEVVAECATDRSNTKGVVEGGRSV